MTRRKDIARASAATIPTTPAGADVDARGVAYRRLCKEFRSRRGRVTNALSEVSFSVRSQEFLAVVGPSGCGKTTLLRLTAGLETPTRGVVEIDGSPVVGARREVGIMFQSPVLLPWRRVIDNVLFPADITGRAGEKDRARAAELLDLVGLSQFADHDPRELSGGMQQRVALARALLSDPELILLDEPFGALDALTREDLNLELMRVWDQRKKTAVLITHSIAEAVFLSDRVAVMRANPGAISEIVDIPLPRPRVPDMRYDPVFAECAKYITDKLMSYERHRGEGA